MGAEKVCAEAYDDGPFTQNVVVNDNGTLANAFVYVKSGLEGNFPAPCFFHLQPRVARLA